MTGFELYIFFLCLLVFISLTALFSFMICYIAKQKGILLVNGLEDDKIKEKLTKKLNKKSTKAGRIMETIEKIASITLCACLAVLLIVTSISSCRGDTKVDSMPAIKVIASTSMSEKYQGNKYLFNNNLDDQLQLFDVVLLHELPKEEDLELYDIVVYEHITGVLLIHRIISIEEPNENHPNERHFLLQGDAVYFPDTYPVKYSQMKSIYRGEKIPNVGSFVYFMQSPAGIICIILLLVSLVLMPIADNYILKREYERVKIFVEKGEIDEKALAFYKEGRKNKPKGEGGGEDA